MSLLSWFGLKTPAPSAPQNTWSLTNTAFPASPRSPSRPLSRMGCGGDYRFQSRGRTAVGFYHPAGRPTASPAGYFYAQLSVCIVGLFWGVSACPRVLSNSRNDWRNSTYFFIFTLLRSGNVNNDDVATEESEIYHHLRCIAADIEKVATPSLTQVYLA